MLPILLGTAFALVDYSALVSQSQPEWECCNPDVPRPVINPDLPRPFDLEAGAAHERLNEFSAQSGLQLLFNHEILKSFTTHEVRGTLKPADALDILIAGTGIKYEFVNAFTVTLTVPTPPETTQAKMGSFDVMLIGETCQFGLLSAASTQRLFGDCPGGCWCCTSANFSEPDAPSSEYFCASLATVEACPAYDGSHTREDLDNFDAGAAEREDRNNATPPPVRL